MKCKELTKICKERNIQYAASMGKQEMVEIFSDKFCQLIGGKRDRCQKITC